MWITLFVLGKKNPSSMAIDTALAVETLTDGGVDILKMFIVK